MPDVTVRCPQCQEAMLVDPAAGAAFECASCGKRFRLRAPGAPPPSASAQPAPARVKAAAPPKPSAPPPDDEEDDDEPKRPAKKKSKSKSGKAAAKKKPEGMPFWVLPAGIATALLLVVGLGIAFRSKIGDFFGGATRDSLYAIPADADEVIRIRPKALAGTQGGNELEALQAMGSGGGNLLAPPPPEGYGFAKGDVNEAFHVRAGAMNFQILRFVWRAKPKATLTVQATHRGYNFYADGPRTVVPLGADMLICSSVDDAKVCLDRFLDAKRLPFVPKECPAAMLLRSPPPIAGLVSGGVGKVPEPRSLHIWTAIDIGGKAYYEFEYETPAKAKEAYDAIEVARKELAKAIEKQAQAANMANGEAFHSTGAARLGNLPTEVKGNLLEMVEGLEFNSRIHGLRLLGPAIASHTVSLGDPPNARDKEKIRSID